MKDYALIFEVNLFASKYLENLKNLIRSEKVSDLLNKILKTDSSFFEKSYLPSLPQIEKESLLGNMLEFADQSETVLTFWEDDGVDEDVKSWWLSLPKWKKKAYGKSIITAINYVKYREYSRILMIKNKTELLKTFKKIIHDNQIDENLTTFFALEEYLCQKLDRERALERMEAYDKYTSLNISTTLSSELIEVSGI